MYSEIGVSALTLSWLSSIYCVFCVVWGFSNQRNYSSRITRSIIYSVYFNFIFLLLSVSVLLMALLSEQYQLSFVWETTSPATPLHLRISALWGGQRGSLLFWSFLMSGFTAIAAHLHWHHQRKMLLPALMMSQLVVGFFSGLVLFLENPFAQYWLTENYYTTGLLQDYVFKPQNTVKTH